MSTTSLLRACSAAPQAHICDGRLLPSRRLHRLGSVSAFQEARGQALGQRILPIMPPHLPFLTLHPSGRRTVPRTGHDHTTYRRARKAAPSASLNLQSPSSKLSRAPRSEELTVQEFTNGSPGSYQGEVIMQEYNDSTQQYMQETDTFSKYSEYIRKATAGVGADWDRYDAEAMAKYFGTRPFLVARRLLQTGFVLGTWLGKRWLDEKSGRAEENFKMRAAELRAALVQLGPAYVKIAQAVSSRPDVVPPVYLEQLSLLQDRIAPFSSAAALDMMEEELGVPIESLFSDISPAPVAAASLGQVYQARLAANGQAVAVKVQRPGVRGVIALDIFILRILAGWFKSFRKLNTDLQAVVDEWAYSLFLEMDYEAEARNGLRFRQLFGQEPGIVIPRVYSELTTKRVLIMEWVEGQRLSQVQDTNLVAVGVDFSLTQLLDSGFYHADPHPGNLLRTPDGNLAYLDFGMMGEMKIDVREALIRASVHLVNREFEALAEDFVDLGLLPKGQETGEVASALTSVFRDAISSGVRNLRFGDLGAELGRTMYRFKFRIPPYFSLVVRSLTVLEGIALKSNPNYKILSSSYPWIARKVLTDDSPQLRATLKALLYKDGRLRVDRLESLLSESTKSVSVTAGSIVPFGGAALAQSETEEERQLTRRRVLKFALSDEGSFIREILVEEVAKGMDAWGRMAFDAAIDGAEERIPQTALSLLPPIPLFADGEEDMEHADNLRRLLALAQRKQVGPSLQSTPGTLEPLWPWEDPAAAMDAVSQAVQQLPSTAQVFMELPPEAQRQALLLPADLAGRVVSRTFARTVRQVVNLANARWQE